MKVLERRLAISFFTVGIILATTYECAAKPWRGIVPLHSTRADVRRLFGQPLAGDGGTIELFEIDENRVQVMYARHRCEQELPADWGNWNVPEGRVINISVTLHDPFPIAKLKIRNLERIKWYTDSSGATYYHDQRRGIEYQVQEGILTAITYGPSAKDRRLRCEKSLGPKLKY